MSYHHTLEAAVESLHEVEELIKGFPSDGQIASIEIDLALQKLRNLYELLLMMRGNEIHLSPVDNRVPATKVLAEDEVVQVEESKKTTVTITSSEEVKTIREEEPSEVKQERKIEKAEKTVTSKKKTMETLADQFKGGPTLLETLSETYKRETDNFTRSKPVSDLMAAIALNERFTFIRELFNNDKKAFESVISLLNDAGNYESACGYLSNELNWDMDDDTVQLLLNILRRKYMENNG